MHVLALLERLFPCYWTGMFDDSVKACGIAWHLKLSLSCQGKYQYLSQDDEAVDHTQRTGFLELLLGHVWLLDVYRKGNVPDW